MPTHKYEILIRAEIEIGGVWEAEDLDTALAQARLELKAYGELSNLTVERTVLLDDEEVET